MSFRRSFRSLTRALHAPLISSRCQSGVPLAAQQLSKPVQSYISTSDDPYVNLSIEHHLLQTAPAESAILLLYVNRPSIIIGRNQNPWLEVNLALLKQQASTDAQSSSLGTVDLVRRRSGGGTVFHDAGNVNWTVISPSASFTRDKHAEMVVRALRSCGADRSRVNTRHDIVLDQGERKHSHDADDTHATPYQLPDDSPTRPLKVSGSAYKLTRGRALHHGTCLLSSPNLQLIPKYLRSPAKSYISARGVESVSSPVTNINLDNEEFIAAVQTEFAKMYHSSWAEHPIDVGNSWLEEESVRKGVDELQSLDWKFLQTPQFTLSTTPGQFEDYELELTARYGAVTECSLTMRDSVASASHKLDLSEQLAGRKLHEISDWHDAFATAGADTGATKPLTEWLKRMLPVL